MRRAVSFVCSSIAAMALAGAAALPVAAAPEPTGPGGIGASALLAIIATVGDDVFSTADVATLTDPAGASTQHYGPYTSDSPDSSTCGNDWATDTFDRHFTVHRNNDGSFTVVEQFKNGSFTTMAGPSPGGCDTNLGGTVEAGVNGSMHGYFLISIPAGSQTSSSPYCDAANSTNADCDTTTFINTHFSPCYPVTCQVSTFFFHYSAGDQSLLYHEWKNASADRGGNNGDIANT